MTTPENPDDDGVVDPDLPVDGHDPESVNPRNSLTRRDTFGIRPDLYEALGEVVISKQDAQAVAGEGVKEAKRINDILAEDFDGDLQVAWNATTTKVQEAHQVSIQAALDASDAAMDAVKALQQGIGVWRSAFSTYQGPGSMQTTEPGRFTIYWSAARNVWVSFNPQIFLWSGEAVVKTYYVNNTVRADHLNIPMPDGETYFYPPVVNTDVRNVEVMYRVNEGTPAFHRHSAGAWSPPQEEWMALDQQWSFTATASTEYNISYTVNWENATFNHLYRIAIWRNGSQVASQYDGPGFGPRWPWENGNRTQHIGRIGKRAMRFAKDDFIQFVVYSNADTDSRRRISSAEIDVTWTEPPA